MLNRGFVLVRLICISTLVSQTIDNSKCAYGQTDFCMVMSMVVHVALVVWHSQERPKTKAVDIEVQVCGRFQSPLFGRCEKKLALKRHHICLFASVVKLTAIICKHELCKIVRPS